MTSSRSLLAAASQKTTTQKPQQQKEDEHDHSHCGHAHHGSHGHSHSHHKAQPMNTTAAAAASIPAPGETQIKETDGPVPSSSKSISVKDLSSPEDYRYVFDRLKAFNIETVSVHSDSISDNRLSKSKLLFWKDAINQIYSGRVYDQPLIRVLAQQIKEKNLSKMWFVKLLNRREKDLGSVQLKDMDELEAYAEEIYSSMLLLTLESMGVKSSEAEHAASHLGRAMGIMTLIRGTPFHIRSRKTYIPTTLTTKYNIVPELLYRGEDEQILKMKEAIFEMASVAKQHLDKAREFKVPEPAHEAFLGAMICDNYLERLRKVDFNVFDPEMSNLQ
eukprot:gene5279-6117_t